MSGDAASFRHLGGGRKGLFLLLRYLFIAAAAYLLIFGGTPGGFGPPQGLMVAAALASNVALSVMSEALVFAWYVEAPVLVADTLWVSWALHSTGTIGQEFFLLYFFVLFFAALGESLLMVLLGSTAISIANLYFTAPPVWTTAHLLRIVFFYVVALFYGNVLTEIRHQRQRADKGFAWAKELEEKVAERTEELRRLYDEAQTANRLKSEFIATMSHELRTPLNTIMGYSDLLLEGEYGSVTPEQAKTLRIIAQHERELQELITATLDLSRLVGGTVALEVRAVDLPDGLRLLADEAQSAWTNPDVQFVWTIATDLPPLRTDLAKLKTVIRNLVGNAAKFTERGRITIDARAHREGVEIAVSDTGVGIPKEQQDVIFEPFRQGDSSTTRRYRGVGLGLYIVRRLVSLLGGTISLESEVGRGSTFRVWLPITGGTAPA